MQNNLILKVCDRLNLSQKELSLKYDISIPTINRWANDDNTIPKMTKMAFELLLENIEYKTKFNKIKEVFKILSN